jgi:hypothetical protein
MPELNGNPGPFSVHSFNERFQLLDPVQFEKEVHRGSMDDDQPRPSLGAFRIIPLRLLVAEAEIRDHRSKNDPVAKFNVLNFQRIEETGHNFRQKRSGRGMMYLPESLVNIFCPAPFLRVDSGPAGLFFVGFRRVQIP